MTTHDKTGREKLRWSVYVLLIAVAVGNLSGRLLSVNSVDRSRLEAYRIAQRLKEDRARFEATGLAGSQLEQRLAKRKAELEEKLKIQRPFLSSNDRSRWLTVRALVEKGTYEIDDFIGLPNWDSIDKVQHRGRDGQLHLYSSKPPLLSTLLAAPYWLIHRLTGATLGTHPYEIGRFLLLCVNIVPLVCMVVLVARLAERFGQTDWGRIFVVAVATLGTFLSTFATVLNNHVVAAVCATVALYAVVQIRCAGKEHLGWFVVAGLTAALAAATELPALSLLVLLGLYLFIKAPRGTTFGFIPAALLVVVAFFATNYVAHNSLRPPYAHRSATDSEDNWYEYTYEVNGKQRQSYWLTPQGIDKGEPCRGSYALHVLVGHHGIFSLTPVWLLSIVGACLWLWRGPGQIRELTILVVLLTVICLAFYIGLRPQQDRNYGGMTSGFRWMFWFAPLWLLVMLPAADELDKSNSGKALGLALLALSVMAATYPTWNPWTHPWIYHWMGYWGWAGLT
jgi:hypothetical protein